MDSVLAKVKGLRKKPFFKLLSDEALFEAVKIKSNACVPYNPDHNLDEDSWFMIKNFSSQIFCLDILKSSIDTKEYDDLKKGQFDKIAYLIAIQGKNICFQKVTPSLYIRRKTIAFGEVAKIEEHNNRIVINSKPDAIYQKNKDRLVFRNLATISSIFPKIDQLYKEATKEEVNNFLAEEFIELGADYNSGKVSKPNRKRISLAMTALEDMTEESRTEMLSYIDDYCKGKLKYDEKKCKFEVTSDEDLKFLLYGVEQRFYTTPFGKERRLANSVQPMD